MRELDHDNLEYQGTPGESVKVQVTPQGTTPLATYTLDGKSLPLGSNGLIQFNLKSSTGQRTDLQMILDSVSAGTYDVVVQNVPNCTRDLALDGLCLHKWKNPPRKTKTFAFFVA